MSVPTSPSSREGALTRPRVVYLSSTPLGQQVLELLRGQACEVVLAETENRPVASFPPYDLGIGFLYEHRIPATEFARPYRWVNFHPAPLPEYRGRNVAYHAIMQAAPSYGGTLHYMDAAFDSGEIIEVASFPVLAEHTAGDLVQLAKQQLVELFKRHIHGLLVGKVPSTPQSGGQYFRRLPIEEEVPLSDEQARCIRALTVAPRFYAKLVIGGRTYRVIPEP